MSNSPHGGGSQKHPEFWYYDQLWPSVRKRMQEGAFEWSARAVLTMQRTMSASKIIARLDSWDEFQFKKKRQAKPFAKATIPTSVIAAKVGPLRANW